MGPNHPTLPVRDVHDGAKVGPTSLRWGDPVWDSVVSPVLDALQADLDGTARGGRVFGLVVKAWKEGVAIGSNKEVGATLHWAIGEVAEGFRLVRDRLKGWQDQVLEVRLREYSRELVIVPRGGVRANGDLLLSVGGERSSIAGEALAGATRVGKGRGMRVICEQPCDAEEQAQVLDGGQYAGYLILPVDETDDYGAMARLGGRAVLLDIAARKGGLPCVSFDYAEAGLYCAQQLMEIGCTDVVLLTRENDSRTYSIGEGYRQAARRAESPMHRMLTADGTAADAFWHLEQRGLLGRKGRKLGLVCADGEVGEVVLRHLDSLEPGAWEIAVAVVGGKRWGARHWAELIWAELDYAKLGAEGAKYLTGVSGSAIPMVKPRYEHWVPRKRAGSAGEEYWRPAMAG